MYEKNDEIILEKLRTIFEHLKHIGHDISRIVAGFVILTFCKRL